MGSKTDEQTAADERTDERTDEPTDDSDRTSVEELTNLGPCHYGQDDEATVMAARSDGTGWIAICDQHKEDAKKDGFEPES